MKTKYILFDADGVVIQSEVFSKQYQKKYGVENDAMLPFFKWEFQNCIIGKSDLKILLNPWLPKWNWNDSIESFLDFWFQAEHCIDVKMLSLIKELRNKGVACYLATNQEKYRTEYMRNEMDFWEVFDDIFSSCEIGYKKPEKEFYSFILQDLNEKHGVVPHEIMFFDDAQENIIWAKKFGINAHFYKNFDDFKNVVGEVNTSKL